jgi:hypothetical protein
MRNSRTILLVLWLACAFVTWNVVFDRKVAGAATEFTRAQILRRQQGQPVISIDDGFSPRVYRAALEASAWAAAVLVAGTARVIAGRRPKPRDSHVSRTR